MALYMLNISVDAEDPNPQHLPENLAINDQESIIEIIVEQLLGYENAIEEYDDNDRDDHNHKNPNIKINLIVQITGDTHLRTFDFNSYRQVFADYNPHLLTGFYELDIPPPKV
jgi:hypothetical protein